MRFLQRLFRNRARATLLPAGKAMWRISLYGIDFEAVDLATSIVPAAVYREINRDELKLSSLRLPPNAVILDIGSQVGIMAIYLAKRFPDSRIHAFEAFRPNYELLLENLERNQVQNVVPRCLAVTGDGREFSMAANTETNPGGSTGCSAVLDQGHENYRVASTTLDAILSETGPCDLLKIDCEGAEHEILKSATRLSEVRRLIGEFHLNDYLRSRGHDSEELERLAKRSVSGSVVVKKIQMCD